MPPAPTAPAIAVAPIKLMVAVVRFKMSELRASGKINLKIICKGVAPIACADSTIPSLTSSSEVSTKRPIYGPT